MINVMNILMVVFLIENQERLVDPTIETCRKIRQEIHSLNEEFAISSEKRKQEISRKLSQLKKKLSCNESI